jgi:hypothetical protein
VCPLRPIFLSEDVDDFIRNIALLNKCRFNEAFRAIINCGRKNWKDGEPIVKNSK